MSDEFQRFLDSLDDMGPRSMDSVDLDALLSLSGQERLDAEKILIDNLVENDWRVPRALVDLESVAAVEPIRRELGKKHGEMMRVELARALKELAGDDSGRPLVIEVLQRSTGWPQRLNAVNALVTLGGPEADAALLEALDDAESTVRGHALTSLLKLRGLASYDTDYYDYVGMQRVRLASPLRSIAAPAAEALRQDFRALAQGVKPAALGFDYRVDRDKDAVRRLVSSIASGGKLDVSGWASLDEREQEWAVHVILSRLTTNPGAAAALARLGATSAVGPLREVLRSAEGELSLEVGIALWFLLGSASRAEVTQALERLATSEDPQLSAKAADALRQVQKDNPPA